MHLLIEFTCVDFLDEWSEVAGPIKVKKVLESGTLSAKLFPFVIFPRLLIGLKQITGVAE